MDYSQFTNKSNVFAVVGVSPDESKWGYKVFKKLKNSGYNVLPINPNYKQIGEYECFSTLQSISPVPQVLITIVPPKITEQVIKTAVELGIKYIWMQPGSESEFAVKYCKENNVNLIYNACFVVDGMKEGF